MTLAATIIADASWCPETGAAGYGYWIASNRGKLGGGNTFKGPVSDSNVAEMYAICNAIYIAQEHKFVISGEGILVQTDCEAAILAFSGWRPLHKNDERMAYYRFHHLVKEIVWQFKHVKGHTRNIEARYRANRYCDKRALAAMRKARDEFRRNPPC